MKNLLNLIKKQKEKPEMQLIKNFLNSMKKQGGKSIIYGFIYYFIEDEKALKSS